MFPGWRTPYSSWLNQSKLRLGGISHDNEESRGPVVDAEIAKGTIQFVDRWYRRERIYVINRTLEHPPQTERFRGSQVTATEGLP
jgi:hypothetical protein